MKAAPTENASYAHGDKEVGALRLSGSKIRKSRFIFTKERRTIRQKSGSLNHLTK